MAPNWLRWPNIIIHSINKVCDFAANDYGYSLDDFQDFVHVVPSAIAELAHWQNQGYVLITPQIQEKLYSIDEIR
jgi:hypothetical protein